MPAGPGLQTLAKGLGPSGGPNAPYTLAGNLQRQGNLAVLPDYTGGRTVTNTNAPQEFVPQIFEESRSYYLLGFKRQKGKDADRRDIKIKVNRDGVMVRSRRSYYSPSDTSQPVFTDVLTRSIAPLLPETDLPLELGLTTTFQASGEPAVSLLLRIGAPAEAPEGEVDNGPALAGPFDAIVGVFDDQAKRVASVRHAIETPSAVGASGFEWQSYFPLKAGRYEVRVGVAGKGSKPAGSVYGYVDVPDLRPGTSAVSGLRLEEGEAATPTLRRPSSAATCRSPCDERARPGTADAVRYLRPFSLVNIRSYFARITSQR